MLSQLLSDQPQHCQLQTRKQLMPQGPKLAKRTGNVDWIPKLPLSTQPQHCWIQMSQQLTHWGPKKSKRNFNVNQILMILQLLPSSQPQHWRSQTSQQLMPWGPKAAMRTYNVWQILPERLYLRTPELLLMTLKVSWKISMGLFVSIFSNDCIRTHTWTTTIIIGKMRQPQPQTPPFATIMNYLPWYIPLENPTNVKELWYHLILLPLYYHVPSLFYLVLPGMKWIIDCACEPLDICWWYQEKSIGKHEWNKPLSILWWHPKKFLGKHQWSCLCIYFSVAASRRTHEPFEGPPKWLN